MKYRKSSGRALVRPAKMPTTETAAMMNPSARTRLPMMSNVRISQPCGGDEAVGWVLWMMIAHRSVRGVQLLPVQWSMAEHAR